MERLSEQLAMLTQIARQIGEKLDVDADLTDKIQAKFETTNTRLDTLNTRMKDQILAVSRAAYTGTDFLKKMSGNKFMFYMIAACVILALIMFVLHQVL